jgi:hypothetical protein
MSDIFITSIDDSLSGKYDGLSTGITSLDAALGKLLPRQFYGLASAPKVGKSAMTLTHFILFPYLDALKRNRKVHFYYFSYEMDLVTNLSRITTTMYSILTKDTSVSPRYFFGKEINKETGEYIKPDPDKVRKYKEIYNDYIVPLFGKRNKYGQVVQEGMLTFYGEADNPTGFFKEVIAAAESKGKVIREHLDIGGKTRKRIVGYEPNDPTEMNIVILDNLRKLIPEGGANLKQTVDKAISYIASLRNMLGWTFIAIIHLNRELSNIDRLRYLGENIYPDNGDIKETGNLSEEANVVMTLFNPKDKKYGLTRHMGVNLSDVDEYRTLHIIEARDIPSPRHIRLNFLPNIGLYTKYVPVTKDRSLI